MLCRIVRGINMAHKRDAVVKLNLRLPRGLHRRLERAATSKNQSLNSEMVSRLEWTFGLEAAEKAMAAQGYRDRLKLIEVRESLDKIIGALGAPEEEGEKK
jgi:uncharacterized protein (DUF1778 family)